MTFWKRENHGDSNASLDARDKMWGERYGQGQRILQAGQLLLCMGLSRRWTHVSIQQSEPTESVKPSVKWHVGYGCEVRMMCQGGCIGCNKGTQRAYLDHTTSTQKCIVGTLVVRWLGLWLPRAQVQLLVRELCPQAAQPKIENTSTLKKWTVPLYSLPGGSEGKEAACSAGDEGRPGFDPWVGKIPRRRWQPTPVLLPGESHGQRSLAGYSPRGHNESDTTEATEHIIATDGSGDCN